MAEENKPQENEMAEKPSTGTSEASEMNKTSEGATKKDIDDVLMVLNEIDQISGGKGKISAIPKELHAPIKFLIEKMITVRDAFSDPLFSDVLDDMDEQRQSGQVPSVLVAVARNVPMEELVKLADDENYENVQNAVNDRVSKEKENGEAEAALYANFDKSKKAIDDYCAEMGYDDARKQTLYATINMLRNCFADGLLTKEEVGKIDKIDNYDSDIASIKSQIPEGSTKTVLPDKASIDSSMAEKSAPKPSQPSIGNAGFSQPDYMNVGKRKIFTKS